MDETTIFKGNGEALLRAHLVLTEQYGVPHIFVVNNLLYGEGMTDEEAESAAVSLGLQKGDPGWRHVTAQSASIASVSSSS